MKAIKAILWTGAVLAGLIYYFGVADEATRSEIFKAGAIMIAWFILTKTHDNTNAIQSEIQAVRHRIEGVAGHINGLDDGISRLARLSHLQSVGDSLSKEICNAESRAERREEIHDEYTLKTLERLRSDVSDLKHDIDLIKQLSLADSKRAD